MHINMNETLTSHIDVTSIHIKMNTRSHKGTQQMSIADKDENKKADDPLVYTPVRLRQSKLTRLNNQMAKRGHETLSPVMRMAIDKGLEVMEQEVGSNDE